MKPLSILLLAATGCGPAAEDDSDAPTWTGDTVPWNLVIETFVTGMDRGGVEVCSLAGCAVSDTDGAVRVDLPVGESTLRLSGPHIVSKRVGITIVDRPPSPDRIVVLPADFAEAFCSDLEIDWTKGTVLGQVLGSPGATVALDPPVGDGPYYLGVNMSHDATATGITDGGSYIFANIEVDGPIEVVHAGLAAGCATTEWSQAGSAEGRTKVEIAQGWSSTTEVVCNQGRGRRVADGR